MSRLIVKGLPNNITADGLKKIFLQKGEITDVQLKYTKDGKFRNFGFVGFKSEEQASEARDHFNGTCIKTGRITVETCASLGDKNKPKAWSKYAPDSTAFKKLNKTEKPPADDVIQKDKAEKAKAKQQKHSEKLKEILEKHKDDPLFAEFMKVHTQKSKNPIWKEESFIQDFLGNTENENVHSDKHSHENDSETEPEAVSNETVDIGQEKIANQAISDLEYMKSLVKKIDKNSVPETGSTNQQEKVKKKKAPKNIQLFNVKIQGLPFSAKKKDIKDFFRPLVPFTIRIPHSKTKSLRGFCYIGFKTEEEQRKALFKNKSFLGGHRVNVDKYTGKRNVNDIDGDEDQSGNYKHKSQEESLKNEETIAESGRIYVRNLPYITTEDELQTLFEKYGPIAEISIPVDKITHQSKGFGHVVYMVPENAVKAYTELDGSIFCGRMLHLLPGKQKEDEMADNGNLTFKEKKALKQKSQAGSSHNWNTLFLGANAVADVVASSYNTTKEKLFEDSSNKTSAAVKLALGETQLVANTRKFLEDNGVSLDAFNQPAKKRSKNVILVKNLPAQTTYEEIMQLFKPFGLIARLIMPPHGITALVEFVEPSEARIAFSKLAYSKFKYLPLYLEWAPNNVFTSPTPEVKADETNTNVDKKNIKEVAIPEKIMESEPVLEEETPEEETVLFVKGLNFETREGELRQHFEKCGRIHSATVAMKNDPRNPGQKLSMGYGFVQFYRKSSAEKALKDLQMTMLDEKQIELKRSERTGSMDVKTTRKDTQVRKQTGTKILVRNIPFQANRREIMEVFGTFGEIKAMRLPKKLVPGEDRHRGFCFVEYFNDSDAKNAFTALCQSTHLYGRRLVLEWAKPEDDNEMVQTLRKRTAELYNMGNVGGKKSKKAVADIDDMEDENDD